ncbi:MAG: hypothetical protein ACK2UO_17395 [Caldilineaceae bacterium]
MSEAPFANETKAFVALAARVEAIARRQVWIAGIGVAAFLVLLAR